MLGVPDRTTSRGRTEYALLLVLYKTGARVSEVTQLTVGDLKVGRNDGRDALVTLHGKGGKIRICPLRPETEKVLAELVDGRADDDAVFLSRLGKPFTRFGVYWLVQRFCGLRSGIGWEEYNASCAEAYDRLPHGACWSGYQHSPRVAWPLHDQYHQHLCRRRSRDEGQGNSTLRCC